MKMPGWMPEPGSPADRVITFLSANMLWFMLAALLIPLPPATAGLVATLAPWIRGKDTELFSAFFGGMRRYWLKSYVIVLFDVAAALLVYLNVTALNMMELNPLFDSFVRGLNLLILLVSATMNIYLWPLLVLFDLPLKRLFNVSVRLALGHPFWSIATLIVASLPLIVLALIPNVFLVLVVFSASALAINWGGWRVISRYITEEERKELDEAYRY